MMKFYARNDEAAISKMREALEINPKALPGYTDGSLIAAFIGDHDTARAFIDSAIELAGEQPHLLAYKAYAHAQAGETEPADRILKKIEPFIRKTKLLFTDLALVNAALGRIEAGLDALERAHSEREYLVATIPVPRFRPLPRRAEVPEHAEGIEHRRTRRILDCRPVVVGIAGASAYGPAWA